MRSGLKGTVESLGGPAGLGPLTQPLHPEWPPLEWITGKGTTTAESLQQGLGEVVPSSHTEGKGIAAHYKEREGFSEAGN